MRDSAGKVTKEQEASIRKKALRERDIIFSKVRGPPSSCLVMVAAPDTQV
jgi:hypothetical protein